MPDTSQYLADLATQRDILAENLINKGVNASKSEKFNTLVAKVSKVGDSWENWITNNYSNTDELMINLLSSSITFSPGFPKLNTGSATSLSGLFKYCYITAAPQMDTHSCTDFSYMFADCTQLNSVPDIDTSHGINFNGMFSGCTSLTTFPHYDFSSAASLDYSFSYCAFAETGVLNTSNITSFYHTFEYCNNLETVQSINLSSATLLSGIFEGCFSLKNITFEGNIPVDIDFNGCVSLTDQSVQNIIDALKDYSSYASARKTLYLPSVVYQRISQNQIATATAKNWDIQEGY